MTEALIYVINGSGFFTVFGMTVFSSIFIGATLYNGDLSKLMKGLVILIPYALLLFSTNILRILDVLTKNQAIDHTFAYAGVITLLVVTVAYIIGLFIGVECVKYAHWSYRKEKNDARSIH